jgi:hypothetical protein
MPRIFLYFFVVTLAVGVMFLSASTQAKDLPVEAFYGRYVGAGFTFGDTGYYELEKRDLDVEIGPEKNGFFVAWTTVLRHPGEMRDRRKSARISFIPSRRQGIYMERSAEDRVGEGLIWATVTGSMLTVRALSIEPNGSYVVQTYYRILFEKGMMLQYRSDRDGDTLRLISGKLTKAK